MDLSSIFSPDRKRRLIKPQLKAELATTPSSSAPARPTLLRNIAAQMNGKVVDSASLVRTRSTRAITETTTNEQPSTSSGGKPVTLKPNSAATSGKTGELIDKIILILNLPYHDFPL